MKNIYITLIMILFTVGISTAQTSKADKLTQTMFESQVNQIKESAFEMAAIDGIEDNDAIQQKLNATTTTLYKELAEQLTATFSDSEIAYLVDFYQSPVGKKLLETSETLYGQTTVRIQDWQLVIEELVMSTNE